MPNARKISEYINNYLIKNNLLEIKAVEAAKLLDKANILKDNSERAGLPLRKLLRAGLIPNSEPRNGRWWYLTRL